MASIICSKNVKTRKPHVCFGCAREFPKGNILLREAIEDGGSVFTAYLCKSCEAYVQKHLHPFDEFGFGDLRDGVLEMEQELIEERVCKL